jgi:hypothetical protein
MSALACKSGAAHNGNYIISSCRGQDKNSIQQFRRLLGLDLAIQAEQDEQLPVKG